MRIIMGKNKTKLQRDPNTGYEVRRRNHIHKQDPKLSRDLVSVTLKRIKNVPMIIGQDSRFVAQISIFSTSKVGLQSRVEVELSKCSSQAQVYYLVEVAAGAAAEHLAEMYGDVLDPDWCAKQAKELFIDVMGKYGEMRKKGQDITAVYE